MKKRLTRSTGFNALELGKANLPDWSGLKALLNYYRQAKKSSHRVFIVPGVVPVTRTGSARVGCSGKKKKKSVLFVFSDDVIETFTEDPSKSARIGGVDPLLLGRGRAESEVRPEKRCHRSSLARSHSTLLSSSWPPSLQSRPALVSSLSLWDVPAAGLSGPRGLPMSRSPVPPLTFRLSVRFVSLQIW